MAVTLLLGFLGAFLGLAAQALGLTSSSVRESDSIVTGANRVFMSIENSTSQLAFVAKVSSPSSLA